MKPIKVISTIVPVLLGLVAAQWTTLAFWIDMKEGLIAFLGFLAASLVQVMPITANFLQSDRLTPNEAKRLTVSLTNQQHYWIGLLSVTIFAMVLVIVGAALKGRVENVAPIFRHSLFIEISWSAVVTFLIAASVSFVLVKMLGLFEGMMSLHRLRGELVLNAAKREASEKSEAIQKNVEVPVSIVPRDYGRVLHPH
jgi:hypothetical protein